MYKKIKITVLVILIPVTVITLYYVNMETKEIPKQNTVQKEWSPQQWELCWQKEKRLFDFTTETWRMLTFQQQQNYARAYQKWYAKKLGVSVEKEFSAGKAIFKMVLIPPGKFWMGSPENEIGRDDFEKQHIVTITKPFWIGKYEVTQKQWQDVVNENPAYFKKADLKAPVEKISWNEAKQFCKKIKMRLPTEAEWEYSCRAGTLTMSYMGNFEIRGRYNAPFLEKIAWYAGNSGVNYEGGSDTSKQREMQYSSPKSGTHEVGIKKPNSWGLHDMLGNVLEYCADWYDFYPDGEIIDPIGPFISGLGIVARGGSWFTFAHTCRAASRIPGSPGARTHFCGLRVCKSLE